jgi:cullin-associated NEDD8-dissociated protein 1
VLGRIGDALNFQAGKEVFDAYSIAGTPKLLDGAPGVSRPADVLTEVGIRTFTPSAFEFESNMQAMNKHVAGSIFAETFSEAISAAIGRKNLLEGAVGDLQLSPSSETCFTNLEYLETPIALQMKQVARIMKQRDSLQSTRSAFYVQLGSFDAHGDNSLGYTGQLLSDTSAALKCFVDDMKTQGLWNDVTIISSSEFGRTLTSNGAGTDHAWGGNHFLMGGQVAGGKIHGAYPDDLSDAGPLNIGRGRLIPTTPWEGVWKGVAEWFGVESQNMDEVLPNLAAFSDNIFGSPELYK